MLSLGALPKPSARRIAIHVTPAAERALRAGHPWVFDRAIRSQSHEGRPGDLAVVFDAKRRFLAIGLYDPTSPIRVRVLQAREPATIDRAWFAARLRAAADIRRPLTLTGPRLPAVDTAARITGGVAPASTDGCRLVHGENDGLPGLIVDRYAATLVLKLYSAAWLPYLADILAGLEGLLPFERIVLRYSRNLDALMVPHGFSDGQVLAGPALDGPVVFQENGLRFAADLAHGHKTGFFFDQRENREQVYQLAAGRRVLDLFAYSGGFSVYAAAGGAASVTSVDISAPALEAAAANFALNRDVIRESHVSTIGQRGPEHTGSAAGAHNLSEIARRGAADEVSAAAGDVKHTLIAADVFDALEEFTSSGQSFDMVIVDPPSFAKSAAEVEGALAAYARLARLATGVLVPGGILVIASCSSRVSADAFFDTVTQAAQQAGRPLRELLRTGHALDHPITFPEGAYLKCLFASVPG